MPTTNYTSLVEAAKVAARDILRMRKISKWLTTKNNLEASIASLVKNYTESCEFTEKKAAIIEFEANATPTEHPNKEAIMENAKKMREGVTKQLNRMKETHETSLKQKEEEMKEIETALKEWTDGTRKVNTDDLAQYTDYLIEEAVTANFTAQKKA